MIYIALLFTYYPLDTHETRVTTRTQAGHLYSHEDSDGEVSPSDDEYESSDDSSIEIHPESSAEESSTEDDSSLKVPTKNGSYKSLYQLHVGGNNTIDGRCEARSGAKDFSLLTRPSHLPAAIEKGLKITKSTHDKLLATPSLQLDDIPNPIQFDQTNRREQSMQSHTDDALSITADGLHVEPQVEKILASTHVRPPTPNFLKAYKAARNVYTEHGYELIPPSNNSSFFLSQPIRLFIAVTPPSLVMSIIKSTNEYIDTYRQGRYKKLTIREFFLYIGVLIDIATVGMKSSSQFFRYKPKKPMLSRRRFNDLTSLIQLNEHTLLNSSEAPDDYDHHGRMHDCIMKFQSQFSQWTSSLLSDITCMVIDESRLGYRQSYPLSPNSNPMSNYNRMKPDPVAMQFNTLHEAQSRMLLNLAPTTRDPVRMLGQEGVLPPGTSGSTAITNFLLTPYTAATCGQSIVLADGGYGSLETAECILANGHHPIVAIKNKTNGLPRILLSLLKPTHNELVKIRIKTSLRGWIQSLFLTRSGKGVPNTTLSSIDTDGVASRFKVKKTNTGRPVDITLSQPHALYKVYANTADIFNSYVSSSGIHRVAHTIRFKNKLFLYIMNILFTQTRLAHELLERNLSKADEERMPPIPRRATFGCVASFYERLGDSLRTMVFYEHHYVVETRYVIDRDELIRYFPQGDIFYVPYRLHALPYREQYVCSSTYTNTPHAPAQMMCLSCRARNINRRGAYACPRCHPTIHDQNRIAHR